MCFVSVCKKTFAQPNRLGLCLSLDHLQMSCCVGLVTFSPRSLSRQQKTNSPLLLFVRICYMYVCRLPPISSRVFLLWIKGKRGVLIGGPHIVCCFAQNFLFSFSSCILVIIFFTCVCEKDKMENNTSFQFCLFYAFFFALAIYRFCAFIITIFLVYFFYSDKLKFYTVAHVFIELSTCFQSTFDINFQFCYSQ